MEELIALVKLFKTMPGNAKARLLSNGQDNLKVMYDFMENINSGKFTSDEDASKHYFNSTPKNTKYYSLKKRLRDKLLAWILNAENPYLKYEELEYAIISLHRLSAQAGILNSIGVYGSANKINIYILKIAAKFDLTEFRENAARNVRDFYALRELNLSKFNFYNSLLKKLNAENKVEHLADELYASFMVAFHSNKKNRSILGNIVTKYILQFEKLLLLHDSEKIKQFISKINILALISEKEFQSALYKVSENLVSLEKKSYQQNVLKNELIQQQMVCYLNLKQFDEGKKVAEI